MLLQMALFHSSLWLRNIPLYIYNIYINIPLYIYIYNIYIIYIYHIFFINSSANGHLGCFHVLAIVNSAAMNVGVPASFQIRFFSGHVPRSGIVAAGLEEQTVVCDQLWWASESWYELALAFFSMFGTGYWAIGCWCGNRKQDNLTCPGEIAIWAEEINDAISWQAFKEGEASGSCSRGWENPWRVSWDGNFSPSWDI